MTKQEINLKKLLGYHIRALRKARKLTQQELGEKAGINYKFLGEIERGTQNPSLLVLSRIAKALNVKTAELFLFEDQTLNREEMEHRITAIVRSIPNDDAITRLYSILKTIFPPA